jgi:hypothetical protein
VIVDPQYWNTRHIDWTHTSKSILVSESSTHPRIFHFLDLPLFFSSSFFPLGQFFESIVGEKGKIGAGGSVATAAWDIARILGLDPIYMAGLDLGYPRYKTHFKGAFFEQTFHTVSYKLKPSETHELAYLLDAGPFFAPSNSNGLTLTDKRMNVYKWWFETQMQIYRDTHTYNLSASGIKVEGMDLWSTDGLLSLPVIRQKIGEITERIKLSHSEQNSSEIAQKTGNMKDAINGLLIDLDRLRTVAGEGLEETKKARERIVGGKIPEETVTKLDTVDKEIRGESSRIIAGFLLQPIIQGIMNSPSKGQGAEGVLETSERLYLELKEAAEFHYEVLDRANREL